MKPRWKFLLLLTSLITCICSARANADEKGDSLLRQVYLRARALAPIAGEYTATQHGPAGDKVEKYKSVIAPGGISQEGGRFYRSTCSICSIRCRRMPWRAHAI